MAPHKLQEQTLSARATTKLIGREEQLAQVDRLIADNQETWLLQISGEGGIGKSRLVAEILRRHQDNPNVLAASQPVDLYHTSTHSIEGLMSAMCAVLDPTHNGFSAYRRAQQSLDQYLAEPLGQAKKLETLRKNVQRAFLADLKGLAGERRVLLVLDTAEKLVYEITQVEKQLGLAKERLATWTWLRTEFLPGIRNTVVILAGRPQISRLAEDMRLLKKVKFLAMPKLPGFTIKEALDYFEVKAQDADDLDKPALAEQIRLVPEEWRRKIAENTEGDPILLALIVDYLVFAPALPEDFLTMDKAQLKRELVRSFVEVERPVSEALGSLAWTRKGMDTELLARVADRKKVDGSWDLVWAQTALEQLRQDISFVKVRPSDQRVFLHDEIYDLMECHVLQPTGRPAAAELAYKSIGAYYREKMEGLRTNLAEAYQELGRTGAATVWQQISLISNQLQEALVEDLHYRLRAHARRGFDAYYRYAEEALQASNSALDAQLRSELLAYWDERDHCGKQAEVDGLPKTYLDADSAIRWVRRCIEMNSFEKALDLADAITDQQLISPEDELLRLELDVWRLAAHIRIDKVPGSYDDSLENAIIRLDGLSDSWRRSCVLAHASNRLGYLRGVVGRQHAAIGAYERAVPLWKMLKLEAAEAATLNNQSFALSNVGNFDRAKRLAKQALEIRTRLGNRSDIGLSLNTIALIEMQHGSLREAEDYSREALTLFRQIDDRRGIALAQVALAEIVRRRGTEEELLPAMKAEELLKQAISYAKAACKGFAEIGELPREVRAYIQLGCAYRDLMYIYREHPGERTVEELAALASETFDTARRLADQTSPQVLDAWVREAWSNYYLASYYQIIARNRDSTLAATATTKAYACLDEASRFVDTYYPDHRIVYDQGWEPGTLERVVVPVLTQVAKIELLKGQMAFNEFENCRDGLTDGQDEEYLSASVGHYTLSLEYDDRASPGFNFRDMRRAKDRISERLQKLDPPDWQMVYSAVKKTEDEYKLTPGESAMSRFLIVNFGSRERLRPLQEMTLG